jgi:hypothetical protein
LYCSNRKITKQEFMKNFLSKSFALAVVILFAGCKEESATVENPLEKLSAICDAKPALGKLASVQQPVSTSAVPYNVSLLQKKDNGDDTYTWIWKITNPNPGNGENGTVQDLSHWGFSLGNCANIEDLVSASTSTDGVNWSSFKADYKIDRSQDCYNEPLLKFDFGTSGAVSSYFRVIVSKNFKVEKRTAIYKSGKNTGCGTFEICSIGCPEED